MQILLVVQNVSGSLGLIFATKPFHIGNPQRYIQLSTWTGLATGWLWAYGYDVQARNAAGKLGPSSWLCCHCMQQKVHKPKAYVPFNTRNIEGHLSKAHNPFNPDPLKAKRYTLERPLNQPTFQDFTAKKREKDNFHDELVARFDKLTFQCLIV
jgi:hypothetical protein